MELKHGMSFVTKKKKHGMSLGSFNNFPLAHNFVELVKRRVIYSTV